MMSVFGKPLRQGEVLRSLGLQALLREIGFSSFGFPEAMCVRVEGPVVVPFDLLCRLAVAVRLFVHRESVRSLFEDVATLDEVLAGVLAVDGCGSEPEVRVLRLLREVVVPFHLLAERLPGERLLLLPAQVDFFFELVELSGEALRLRVLDAVRHVCRAFVRDAEPEVFPRQRVVDFAEVDYRLADLLQVALAVPLDVWRSRGSLGEERIPEARRSV